MDWITRKKLHASSRKWRDLCCGNSRHRIQQANLEYASQQVQITPSEAILLRIILDHVLATKMLGENYDEELATLKAKFANK